MALIDKLTWEQRTKAVLLIVIVLIFMMLLQECEHIRELEKTTTLHEIMMSDTIVKYRNKEGVLFAKTQVLKAENTKAFTDIKSKDSTIQKLQNLVVEYKRKLKEPGSTAIVISTEGEASGQTATVVTVDPDCPDANPTYTGLYDFNGWVWGEVIANKDSIGVSVRYRDEFSVVIGEEGGFLKKKKPFALITSKNPYTDIKEYKTFQVEAPPPKRFSVGPGLMFGLGAEFKPGIFAGVAVQYSLIRF
jgi:hypothetical protein